MKKLLLLSCVLLSLFVSACDDDDKDAPNESFEQQRHLSADQYDSLINTSWDVAWRRYVDSYGNELTENNILMGSGFKGLDFVEDGYFLTGLNSGDNAFVKASFNPATGWLEGSGNGDYQRLFLSYMAGDRLVVYVKGSYRNEYEVDIEDDYYLRPDVYERLVLQRNDTDK